MRKIFRTSPGAVMALALCVCLGIVHPALDAVELDPVKSPRDQREYRYLTLPNALRVLLISDPGTDKGAAALDIDVGSRHDPDSHLGLAHFLEHMLFLGTEKFPEAGDYQRFIQEHGGSNNASTGYGHTNYFFEVDKAALRGALERFSQFFVAPLFNETYVNRERNAVHSEYQARLNSDGARTWDAMKQAFNPAHPLSRFSIGSLTTLASPEPGVLRQALLEFWTTHYSSNRMTLTVYGAEPLAELQRMVATLFGAVINRNLGSETDQVTVPLFVPGRLPALLQVVPERDLRTLSLSFPVPSARQHFRAKPTYYLSNIIGHEGKGSLLSVLKSDGLSDGLSSGLSFDDEDGEAMFRINVRLTERGLARVPEVVARVFQLIEAIRARGVEAWRQQEQERLLALGFEFQEPSSPVGYATELARAMHYFPAQEVLRGPYLLTESNPPLIGTFLERLRPENMLVVLTAQGLSPTARSPYFDAPYALGPLPADWPAAGKALAPSAELALPEPNIFIPESLALKPDPGPGVLPRSVDAPDGLMLFHAQDPSYRVPKANVYLSVRSPLANDTARHSVLTELYVRLVREQLQEFSYPATLAGLDYQLYPHARGFTLRVSGYDDKLGTLFERVTATLRSPAIDPERFAVELDDYSRALANEIKDRSFRLAMREISEMLLFPSWSEAEKLAALKDVDPQALAAFVPQLLAGLNAVLLAHGNVLEADTRGYGNAVERSLLREGQTVAVPRAAVVRLDAGKRYRRQFEVEHPDSGIAVYFQGASRELAERARFALLGQVVAAPFYLELRTQRQLGYVVFATSMNLFDVPGLSFVIQSPGTPSPELDRQIHEFIGRFDTTLASMTDAEFERHRAGLLSRILESDKTLRERSDRYWVEIDRGELSFDTHEKLAAAVRVLDKADLQTLLQRSIRGPEAREIASWAVGAGHRSAVASSAAASSAQSGASRALPESVAGPREFQQGKEFYRSP